jgi:hypothetical protein
MDIFSVELRSPAFSVRGGANGSPVSVTQVGQVEIQVEMEDRFNVELDNLEARLTMVLRDFRNNPNDRNVTIDAENLDRELMAYWELNGGRFPRIDLRIEELLDRLDIILNRQSESEPPSSVSSQEPYDDDINMGM